MKKSLIILHNENQNVIDAMKVLLLPVICLYTSVSIL